MTIRGIDWILAYSCDRACPHCFFETRGNGPALSAAFVDRALGERRLMDGMFFQHVSGGEPSLFDDDLEELVRAVRRRCTMDIGVSTNGRWAADPEHAAAWIRRMAIAGATGISVSRDARHGRQDRAALAASAVAEAGLGRHSWLMVTRAPDESEPESEGAPRGRREYGLPVADVEIRALGRGSTFLRRLAKPGLPNAPCSRLSECLGARSPFEPAMVWIDPYGNVMICYGLVIGSLREHTLAEIVAAYAPETDPVLAALAERGPIGLYRLAERLGLAESIEAESGFVDECDLCFRTRRALRPAFPATLGPDECYPR